MIGLQEIINILIALIVLNVVDKITKILNFAANVASNLFKKISQFAYSCFVSVFINRYKSIIIGEPRYLFHRSIDQGRFYVQYHIFLHVVKP